MRLLPDQLRGRLPPRFSQEAEDEPFVYARFVLPGTILQWFIIEGQPEGDDYLFFGLAIGRRADFREFRLSELLAKRSLFDDRVQLDEEFSPGRLTDVVPAPDV